MTCLDGIDGSVDYGEMRSDVCPVFWMWSEVDETENGVWPKMTAVVEEKVGPVAAASLCPGGKIGAVATGFSCCSFIVVTIASLNCLRSSVVSKLVELDGGVDVEDGSGA